MIKKLTALIIALSALVIPAFASVPEVSSFSAVVIDAHTGEVLFEKNKDVRRGPASTTKIMTAITALEYADASKNIRVDKRAVGVEGSSVYLKDGQTMTLEALLYALMLQSANDAAEAIAYGLCGEKERFTELMNKKCESLGLRDTHFENPHGLDGETHYTTAHELAKIAAYAMKNEVFRKIVSTKAKKLTINELPVTLVNHNRLLREYNDITGIKTGFTKKCGRTLVSSAKRGNVELICVTLGAPDDWRDHRAMLDYAFGLYEFRTLAAPYEFDITLPDGTRVYNRDGLGAGSRQFGEVSVSVNLEDGVDGAAGYVSFYNGKELLGKINLYKTQEKNE